jgi:hypothetical protein
MCSRWFWLDRVDHAPGYCSVDCWSILSANFHGYTPCDKMRQILAFPQPPGALPGRTVSGSARQ